MLPLVAFACSQHPLSSPGDQQPALCLSPLPMDCSACLAWHWGDHPFCALDPTSVPLKAATEILRKKGSSLHALTRMLFRHGPV